MTRQKKQNKKNRKPQVSKALILAQQQNEQTELKLKSLEAELGVMKDKSKLTLTKSPISKQQILAIFQRTPEEHIYSRVGKGGREFDYVTGVYVKKVLNFTFGWLWSFQVVDKGREENQVWVQGRLTINDENLKPMIIKEQFGRADIKFYKDKSKGMVDYGNDLKAAATDALKKCAAEIGIANDVYGKNEFRETVSDQNTLPPGTPAVSATGRSIIGKPAAPGSVKVSKVSLPAKPVNYIDQVKIRLGKLGAKTEAQGIKILHEKTGLVWKKFSDVTPTQAKIALAALIQSK